MHITGLKVHWGRKFMEVVFSRKTSINSRFHKLPMRKRDFTRTGESKFFSIVSTECYLPSSL